MFSLVCRLRSSFFDLLSDLLACNTLRLLSNILDISLGLTFFFFFFYVWDDISRQLNNIYNIVLVVLNLGMLKCLCVLR